MAKIEPLSVPPYARVAWLFGRRLRTDAAPAVRKKVARAIAAGAAARGLELASLHGAFSIPVGEPHGDLVLGALLNGAPIVRDAPELRDGVLSKVHRATQARFELSAPAMHSSDEDLSVDAGWSSELGAVLDDVEASEAGRALAGERVPVTNDLICDVALLDGPGALRGLAWHIVARVPGDGGALFFGTLLPGAGGGYEDAVVRTVPCTDEEGQVVARLVGRRLLEVDATRPVATLPAELAHDDWRTDVSRRLETLTGRFRPTTFWLVAP